MTKTTLVDRALVRLSGEDVRGFLQGLVTNDVLGQLPVWAGLLTPQGKALFDFLVWADGDDLLLDCEASEAPALVKRLSMYRLRKPITIAVDPTLAVHWSIEVGQGVPDPRDPGLGFRWIAPPGEPAKGWLAHRLSRGIVEGMAELGNDKTLWLECNAREQNGVSFTKGCYVGQENTARMHHRDKVNRKLVVEPVSSTDEDARAVYPELGLAVRVARVGS
ncbi:YgfZ/GcvT domain-containing protein [Aquisediminimonas profunda]|uniref:CAF17-like 4Fe-4S cluster assembly/insertion protein YgfZ n=1 Tax=Aquisediminimonas profunda TaxID=1550733 RepID=UPI001C62EB8C|nr:folate-binding protein [Aquisediminimonas profunda]